MKKKSSANHVPHELNILLADDDKDDCQFFKDILEELQLKAKLTAVHDGGQLMKLLTKNYDEHFDVLFLDLNMPRKNGFACLEEIKGNPKLKAIPVIIISTSFNENIADKLYKNGVQHFICKPADFSQLKKLIQEAIAFITKESNQQPSRDKFLLKN